MTVRITCVVFLLFALAQLVSAAGIAVSPSKLDLQADIGGSATVEIVASNPTADVQLFEVYPDDFKDVIAAVPASFTLEAGGRKTVTVTVSPKDGKSSVLTTDISILARPLADAAFQANTGVKIPLTIRIGADTHTAERPWPRWVFWAYAAAAVLVLAAWRVFVVRRQRRAG